MSELNVDYDSISLRVGQVFRPNTPIDTTSLFSGRKDQIRRVVDVVYQSGQHAIIFGEKGVGKTSLANVLALFGAVDASRIRLVSARVNGDSSDSFESIWRKSFDELQLIQSKNTIGFAQKTEAVPLSSYSFIPNAPVTPDVIRRALLSISGSFIPILIIDEFDKLNKEVRKLFAELIKNLSDHAIPATIVLIGVADSVDQLIEDHQSISRALVQVQMPRMSEQEIIDIINNGLSTLGMTIKKDALKQIALLSQGFPYYTHLIGMHATRDALDNKTLEVDGTNVEAAIKKSIKDAQQSIISAHHLAIKSAHKDTIFADVLLACALTKSDLMGTFSAQDITTQLEKITGKRYEIPSFARHLNDFCDDKRGKILVKLGQKRRFRYRFNDPLMQPHVIMEGVLSNKIETKSILPLID